MKMNILQTLFEISRQQNDGISTQNSHAVSNSGTVF